MSNRTLMKAASAAIEEVFSDRSVSQEKALENMRDLREEIDSKIDCILHELGKGR